jgi:hypothetical protein
MITPHIASSAIKNTLGKTAVLLSSTTSIIIIILSLLWVASDVSKRFANQTAELEQAVKSVNITPLNLPTLNAELLSQLNMNYQPYQEQVPVKQNIDSMGMSAAVQANQQGELTSFFIKDNKVELKAVIKNIALKDLNALILMTNIKTGDKTLNKYQHLSELEGYIVAIDKNTQVTLTKSRAQGPQKVILTMYRSELKSKNNE